MDGSIVAIVGLLIFMVVREYFSHKERIVVEKLKKAETMEDVIAIEGKKVKLEEVKEPELVDVADMPDLGIDKGE